MTTNNELNLLVVFRRSTDRLLPDEGRVIGCYGVGCDHGTCLRYTAIEHIDPNTFCMGRCPRRADGSPSMYVPDEAAILRAVRVPQERRA